MSTIKTVSLGSFITISKGKKYTISQSPSSTSQRYIQIDDLRNNKNIIYTDDIKGVIVTPADIIIAWDGANAGTIGYGLAGKIGSTLARLRINPESEIKTRYLGYFLKSKFQEIRRNCTGATIPHVHKDFLLNMSVPLPEKGIQEKIGNILDKVDILREKRAQAIKLTDDFLRATFLDMFGDPENNHKNFPIGIIRDLVSSANYGSSGKASENSGRYPMLRMGNITYEGDWDFTDLKYIDLDEKSKEKFLVQKGDLLFNRTNSKELVGKTAVFENDTEMAFAGYLVRVRPNEIGNNYYISGYLNSSHGKNTLVNMSKSIVGMANINAQEMQNIKILIPPKELQDRYEGIYKAVKNRVTTHIESKNELEKLFSTLSNQFFK